MNTDFIFGLWLVTVGILISVMVYFVAFPANAQRFDRYEKNVAIRELAKHDGMTLYEFHRGTHHCFIVRTKVMGGTATSSTC